MKLDHTSGKFGLAFDLQAHTDKEDFGFTERFVRRLFFDNVYCIEKYFNQIRPQRRGAARPKAANALDSADISISEQGLLIEHQQVMQAWERPLMTRMARGICTVGASVLEIGFGLGISAREIQSMRPRRHVIVEANPAVAEIARRWQTELKADIEIIESRWENADFGHETFDGVLFDAYPSDEEEVESNLSQGKKAAEKFFPTAEKLTADGGKFTFYSGSEIGLPLRLQDELFLRFGTIRLERVSGLKPPEDCNYWINSEMVVVFAEKLHASSADGVRPSDDCQGAARPLGAQDTPTPRRRLS
jgi:guanidinoacetate N-methyltransferase